MCKSHNGQGMQYSDWPSLSHVPTPDSGEGVLWLLLASTLRVQRSFLQSKRGLTLKGGRMQGGNCSQCALQAPFKVVMPSGCLYFIGQWPPTTVSTAFRETMSDHAALLILDDTRETKPPVAQRHRNLAVDGSRFQCSLRSYHLFLGSGFLSLKI
jgi:hypothetical protein